MSFPRLPEGTQVSFVAAASIDDFQFRWCRKNARCSSSEICCTATAPDRSTETSRVFGLPRPFLSCVHTRALSTLDAWVEKIRPSPYPRAYGWKKNFLKRNSRHAPGGHNTKNSITAQSFEHYGRTQAWSLGKSIVVLSIPNSKESGRRKGPLVGLPFFRGRTSRPKHVSVVVASNMSLTQPPPEPLSQLHTGRGVDWGLCLQKYMRRKHPVSWHGVDAAALRQSEAQNGIPI